MDSKKKLKDPWDQDYSYESNGNKFEIVSAGIDGDFGTDDDIYWPEREEGEE